MTNEKETSLTWSLDVPSEPGYYWARTPGKRDKSIILRGREGQLWRFGVVLEGKEFAGPFPKPPVG